MDEISSITAWTLEREVPIPNDIGHILVAGEQPITAYATTRDSAIFTTKRIIIRDAQGFRGRKVEMYSIPYSSIVMWSSENAGRMDSDTELELWTRAGHLKIHLGREIDIRKLDHLISSAVLGAF